MLTALPRLQVRLGAHFDELVELGRHDRQVAQPLGDGMAIAPPQVLARGATRAVPDIPEAVPFAIPMDWERYEAHLVVRMQPAR